MTANGTPRQNQIPALTGLRAVAATLVFFYHWLFDEPTKWSFVPQALIKEGYLGVAVFFALSGFLIATRYDQDLRERRISYRTYLVKRFARIYPLYFFMMTFMVIAFGRPVGQAPGDAWTALTDYTLTQALFPSLLLSGTATAWTLTIEAMFYLVAPALLRWLSPGDGRASAVALSGRAMAIGAASVGLALLLSVLPPLLSNTLLGAKLPYLLQYSIFGRLPDLLAGMVCGLIYLRYSQHTFLRRHATKLAWAGLAAMVLGVFASHLIGGEVGAPLNRVAGFGVALSSGVFVLGTALDERRASILTRFMGFRPVEYLGKLSYGLYLVQLTEPCQWVYWILLGPIEGRVPRALALYAITTLMCLLLYELVEKPAQRWLVRRYQLAFEPARRLPQRT